MQKVKILILAFVFYNVSSFAQQDYSKTKTLHLVSNAHLDTQYRWTVETTIDEYLKNTLSQNFALFSKYPFYVFNFEGAIRYMWIKEHYPLQYDTLKQYIATNKWNICGSSLDAGDVNIPSPEAITRNILLGQSFYQNEFGKVSCDLFLPDCFGFGYALPGIAKHCGLKGFSTQKMTWGSAVGVPFELGLWQGVDGSRITAVLNAEPYSRPLEDDQSNNQEIIEKINAFGDQTGQYVKYKYYGVGDRGGAPSEESVQWLGKSIKGSGPVQVISAPADLLFRQLNAAKTQKFPIHNGELLMTTHATGCYTSHSVMKRWNRKNELLADAAERASVFADWLGAYPYPKQRLTDAWTRFLWHQFHDDLTGTSTWDAYNFSWNDEVIAMNQFAGILENAAGGAIRALQTRGTGHPMVIYNPLSFVREEIIQATIQREARFIKVLDAAFNEVPVQITRRIDGTTTILFPAKAPSIGFAVYDIQIYDQEINGTIKNELKATPQGIENKNYKVIIDQNGDVSSIFDKLNKKEILSAPIRFQMLNDSSNRYPAWEIQYNAVNSSPRSYVDEDVKIEVTEEGPARASVKITRKKEGSIFVQHVRLGANSDRVEFENEVLWETKGTLLKVAFPLSVSNKLATYDLGFGTIQRGNNTEKMYEVPAQQWADITDQKGTYGVVIMNDCKYGWDKPADNTLRLTLFHTPGVSGKYTDQERIDIGRHRFNFAISGHKGDWRSNVQKAAAYNQPLIAFETRPLEGNLGREISFVNVNSKQVIVRALKKAENSNEIVIRLQEIHGKPVANVKVKFPMRIKAAREVNGAEEAISKISLKDTVLTLNFQPYQPRTIALTLAPSLEIVSPASSIDLGLDYNIDAVSTDSSRDDGNIIDGKTFPSEQFPATIDYKGIIFKMGLKADRRGNAMSCKGDKITIPAIQYRSLYFLAASRKNDVFTTFTVDGKAYPVYIQSMFDHVGSWDKPMYVSNFINGEKIEYLNFENAFIKRENIAWYATHLHNAYSNKNEVYKFGYLFCYKIDLPDNAKELILPKDDRILIFAMSMGKNPNEWSQPAHDLYDRAEVIAPLKYTTSVNGTIFNDQISVTLFTQRPGQTIYYTTDGSGPDENSTKYESAITVNKTTILKAKVFLEGYETGYEITVPLVKGTPLPAINYKKIVPGLELDIYEGSWKLLPYFDTMKSIATVVIDNFHIANDYKGKDEFGHRFKGYIQVPTDGIYKFYVSSDDGVFFAIDNKTVVSDDGIHTSEEEKSGAIILQKGLHEVRLDYFEGNDNEQLQVLMEGPNMKKQPVPASMLFRKRRD